MAPKTHSTTARGRGGTQRIHRREMITRAEVAAIAGVEPRTVAQWIYRTSAGEMDAPFPAPAMQVGSRGTYVYRRTEVETFLVRSGRMPITIDTVAEILRIGTADVDELIRIGALTAPHHRVDGSPRWNYPRFAAELLTHPDAREFMLGRIDLPEWRQRAVETLDGRQHLAALSDRRSDR